MLASASDDGTVRVWGTEEQMKLQQHHLKLQEARERLLKEEEGASRTEGVQVYRLFVFHVGWYQQA